jgi:hypothetical protein
MIPNFQEIINEFPNEIGNTVLTPLTNFLIKKAKCPTFLDAEKAIACHHTIAKLLWTEL